LEGGAAGGGEGGIPLGELFPRVGFIVTNLAALSRAVVCRAAKLDPSPSFDVHPVFERLHQPGLADARLAAKQHYLALTLPGLFPSVLQQP
jgi:hypothetical protein